MPPTAADGKKKKKRGDPHAGTKPRCSQAVYVAKIHKAQHGTSMTISQAAVSEIDRVIEHIIENIAESSKEVLKYTKGETLNDKILQSAVETTLSGDLKRRAIRRAKESVAAFKAASVKPAPVAA